MWKKHAARRFLSESVSLVQSFFIRVMLVWNEAAVISRPFFMKSVVALFQSIYEGGSVAGAKHIGPRVWSGQRTLSLDIADFWSLMLMKAAPRRCLSESVISL